MHKRGICRHPVSVCPSVRHVREISPSGSQTILVFARQTGWRCSDGNPLNGGVECNGGMKKWRFSTNISFYLRNGYTLCPKKTVVPNFGDNFVKS